MATYVKAAENLKLYKTQFEHGQNKGATSIIEFKGTTVTVYGTEEAPGDITTTSDMTPCTDALTDDFYYPIDYYPTYICFSGTFTRLNLKGVQLEYIKTLGS